MKFVIFSIILITFASSIDAGSQVKVYFFGKNITNFEIFTSKDIKNLSETSSKYFDKTLKTFIYVPGLLKPFNDEEPQTVIKSLLPLWSRANILFVDWSSCPTDYYGAKEMFKEADKILSELIKADLRTKDTHLIGFGLGTFVVGYIAKFFNNASLPLGRVTGLNPHNLANAPFMAPYEINRNDATFVDIIHVDEVFGNPTTQGHVDFWPNGGKDQPGCYGAGEK
jgi:Lipase